MLPVLIQGRVARLRGGADKGEVMAMIAPGNDIDGSLLFEAGSELGKASCRDAAAATDLN
ncbi:MAG: hypothetical protein NVS3B12_09740 [Acidimicrobiales bacterium]